MKKPTPITIEYVQSFFDLAKVEFSFLTQQRLRSLKKGVRPDFHSKMVFIFATRVVQSIYNYAAPPALRSVNPLSGCNR